jgi:hypothetical protein
VATNLYKGLKKIILNKKQLKKIVANKIKVISVKAIGKKEGRPFL